MTTKADFSEEDWNNIIDTNLTGTLRAAQVFGRHMLERESGSIMNIASLSTFVALNEVAAGAKGGNPQYDTAGRNWPIDWPLTLSVTST